MSFDAVLALDAGGNEVIHDAYPHTDSKITSVKVWTGAYVAAITVVFKKADDTVHELPALGEPARGPTLNEFNLDGGEFITAISGRYGALVASVRIHTNSEQESPLYGGGGGTADYRYEAPDGCEICGSSEVRSPPRCHRSSAP